MRQMTIEKRRRCIAWLHDGDAQRNVAVRTGISQSVFGRPWGLYKQRILTEALQTEGGATSPI